MLIHWQNSFGFHTKIHPDYLGDATKDAVGNPFEHLLYDVILTKEAVWKSMEIPMRHVNYMLFSSHRGKEVRGFNFDC